MLVKEIMTSTAETIDSGANLIEAAHKMKTLEVGALPVWEDDELVGMITDRDITIRATSNGKDPASTKVTEVMTPEIFYCLEDEDIHMAAEMMEEKSIHRLLVLNNDYEPVGFVSRQPGCRGEYSIATGTGANPRLHSARVTTSRRSVIC